MSRAESEDKYQQLLNECDQLIKAGKISAVAHLISDLNFAQVPRSSRQALAKICRRVGLVSQGLRLLQPIIRQDKTQVDPATAGEISEYSVLLSRNGSHQEAIELLSKVDASKTPEASMYLGFCYISTWEYAKAIGFLESFLQSAADDYSKLIARVNLISAHLAVSQFSQADELLKETIPLTEQAGASRLVGNCLELRSRVYLHQRDFAKARSDLEKALTIFGSSQVYDRLFIYKWQAIITALESKSIDPLLAFRKEAIDKRQWESVREADLFRVKVQFDQKLLDYLTYGTPMIPYRQRIQEEIGGQVSPEFILGQADSQILDLRTGKIEGNIHLSAGKKIHQVIASLVKDFYLPRNIGTLFSELYPDEYFDINSSPLRVRQLLSRTRQWLQDNDIPASIEQNKGTYRFSIDGAFGIQIPLHSSTIESTALYILKLRSVFSEGQNFTAKQACEKLNWPRSTFLLFANLALEKGELLKEGVGKSTVYKFAPVPDFKKSPSAA